MKPSVSAHQHSDIGDIMITIITRSMHIIIIIVATINEQIAHIFLPSQILQHLSYC